MHPLRAPAAARQVSSPGRRDRAWPRVGEVLSSMDKWGGFDCTWTWLWERGEKALGRAGAIYASWRMRDMCCEGPEGEWLLVSVVQGSARVGWRGQPRTWPKLRCPVEESKPAKERREGLVLLVVVFCVAGGFTHPAMTVVGLCLVPALLLGIRRQRGEVAAGGWWLSTGCYSSGIMSQKSFTWYSSASGLCTVSEMCVYVGIEICKYSQKTSHATYAPFSWQTTWPCPHLAKFYLSNSPLGIRFWKPGLILCDSSCKLLNLKVSHGNINRPLNAMVLVALLGQSPSWLLLPLVISAHFNQNIMTWGEFCICACVCSPFGLFCSWLICLICVSRLCEL